MILNKKEAIKRFKQGFIVQRDFDNVHHFIEGGIYGDVVRADTIRRLEDDHIIEEFREGIHYQYRLKLR